VRLLPCFAVRVRLFREAQLSWTSTAGDCSLGTLGLIMILAHCHYLLELLDAIRYQRKAPLSFTACFIGLGAFSSDGQASLLVSPDLLQYAHAGLVRPTMRAG
jgi:hypothetical protein